MRHWIAFCLLMCGTFATAQERPNIVLFLADDLGYADPGFNGGKEIATPQLDQLASRGVVLESFYVQPVCSPTRAALMTGRYPMRYGLQVGVIRPWAEYGLPLEEQTLAAGLRQAGYATAICGKWHLGSFDRAYWPNARGFDHAYGHLFGALDYFTHIRDNKNDWYRNGEPVKEEGYTTHLLAREAISFIQQQSTDKPFFLYVPFNAVHTPLQVPESYLAPYQKLPKQRQLLAGMLAALDEAVGQIEGAVQAKGLAENTLFLFSSDNGGFAPGRVTDNTPLRAGKGTLYEGGVRSCAFATWPGQLPAGTRNREPLHIVDWYPTLLKLAGAKIDQALPLDGHDVWSTLRGEQPSPHQEILFNTSPTSGAIRMGDWKLVMHRGSPTTGAKKGNSAKAPRTWELYNLKDDLSETTDVAKQHPDVLAKLRKRLLELEATAVAPKNQENDAQ